MSTTSPAPFPTNGMRALSPRETMQRLKANSCTLPQQSSAVSSCSGQVHVGIFFDGTGNNMKADFTDLPPAQRKHSNVVKLFRCMPTLREAGRYSYYIPGVGTPFPDIGENKAAMGGGGAGVGGAQRITWAMLDLINAPHMYVHNALLIDKAQAKTISGNIAGTLTPDFMRRVPLRYWQDKLQAALLDQKPRVEQINVSVFGFSRGAAQARAFVNWLFEVCEQKDGGWTFAGIPFRLQFLGIFDTVASVGLADLTGRGVFDGRMSWADNNLQIHPAVEQCVHYVAGHEVRSTFSLDSVRVKSSYPSNAMEVMYPGVHSDVGGGYSTGDLGVSPTQDSFVSIIPGVSMYRAARLAGVPLLAWGNLLPVDRESLTPSDAAVQSFNAYVRDAAIGHGQVEQMGRRHMSLFFSHRFKHRAAFYARPPFTLASPEGQRYLRTTQESFIQRLSTLASRLNAMGPDFDPPRMAKLHEDMNKAAGLTGTTTKEVNAVEVAKSIDIGKLTPAVEHLFDHYLHDSMAGFMKELDEFKWNGLGIVRFRTVYKGND
jgi:Uncharacterized alpha/beta hydrolase domain (DUF2235)